MSDRERLVLRVSQGRSKGRAKTRTRGRAEDKRRGFRSSFFSAKPLSLSRDRNTVKSSVRGKHNDEWWLRCMKKFELEKDHPL
jgi:hypothetical protein